MNFIKKIFLGLVMSFAITAQANQTLECKEIYENKLSRMEKTRAVRKIGKVAVVVSAGVAGGLAIASTMPLLPLGVVLVTVAYSPFGALPASLIFLLDRETSLTDSYSSQNLMFTSYAELLAPLEAKRDEILKKALEDFANRITHSQYVASLVLEVNNQRLAQNLPALSANQVIALTREKIIAQVMSEKLVVVNQISASLELAKRKSELAKDMTYDDWREHMIKNQSAFCPKRKAIGLRAATKNLIKEL